MSEFWINNKLTEMDPVPESSEVNKLRQEFIKQYMNENNYKITIKLYK